MKYYRVVKINQGLRGVWSQHETLEAAERAVRRYRRLNPDTESWVDHYGYQIETVDPPAETI